jgi:hypothetical protein
MQPASSYTEIIVQPSTTDQSSCDASIIVVSFNTRELLRECLESIIRESANLSVEILVVDNNSLDGSPQMVEEEFPQVRLLRSEINLGFGSANNLALAHARGRYFVLLNSDAFFQSAALELAIRHMDETPECGLAGGRLIGRDGSWQPSARSFHPSPGFSGTWIEPGQTSIKLRRSTGCQVLSRSFDQQRSRRPDCSTTLFFSITKKLTFAVGSSRPVIRSGTGLILSLFTSEANPLDSLVLKFFPAGRLRLRCGECAVLSSITANIMAHRHCLRNGLR